MSADRTSWSQRRAATLSDDLDILLGELCVQWGFCNQLNGEELVRDRAFLTSADFANCVLVAEGMAPSNEQRWLDEIGKCFRQRYGHVVSTSDFRPSTT